MGALKCAKLHFNIHLSFQQTSSVAYPMVMAQQYFLTHRGVDPTIIAQAKKHLEASYKRLTGFEVKEQNKPTGGMIFKYCQFTRSQVLTGKTVCKSNSQIVRYGQAPANESLT